MKKLFLQSGKIMIGEFPEEYKEYCHDFDTLQGECPYRNRDGCACANAEIRDNAAFESAKASAVEAVNPEAILTWDDREVWFFEHRAMAEDKLYDIPSGWTVEIKEACASDCCSDNGCCEHCREPVKIARLVPSENAQGEKPGSGWSKRNLNVQYVGGIVATGIPEAEQPESKESFKKYLESTAEAVPEGGEKPGHDFIKYLKRNELDYYNQREEWNEDTPQWRMYNAIAAEYILIRNHFEKHFSVSPPPQADRNSQEELWKEAINLYSKRDHSADGRADMMKEFTITRNTKP